ncbi:hypothetical protein [Sphingomonas sp.]|uniref:hypothetical protein n=1 Tax=Sphingomonas sp. TaxID=28214 RepID=UPI003B3A6431
MRILSMMGLMVAVTALPSMARAGAGANIQACVFLPTAQAKTLTFNFSVGRTKCMNDKGNNAVLTTSSAGMSCTSAGYVEEKGSSTNGGTCATQKSHWVLGYSSTTGSPPVQNGYSGSSDISMSRGSNTNNASMSSYSAGTQLCSSNALCSSTSQKWPHGKQGPLYLIFQPGYQPTAKKK